jgi:hypothetical protein
MWGGSGHVDFLIWTTLPSSLFIVVVIRRQIELFFKWIKQHLRIKSFYKTSESVVKTQIWIAISVYVLIAIIILICSSIQGGESVKCVFELRTKMGRESGISLLKRLLCSKIIQPVETPVIATTSKPKISRKKRQKLRWILKHHLKIIQKWVR